MDKIEKIVKEVINETVEKDKIRKMHVRPKTLNEDVMKKYWNIDKQCAPVLVEHITIDRIMKKHGDNGFIVISANRSDMDDARNTEATKKLIEDLKNSGFSYLPTYGGYHDNTSDVSDSFEPSFIVFNYDTKGNKRDFNDLYQFALAMCEKYEQASVYVNEPGKAPNYVNSKGEITNRDSSRDYIKNDLEQEYFTSLSSPEEIAKHGKTQKIGRRFTSDIQFENKIYVNPMPSSHVVRMMRKGEIMVF